MEAKWWTLIAVCCATFMFLLDVTIVIVALPDIRASFGADLASVQWTIDAYALSLAAVLLTAGSLADTFGRRRLFLIGLAVFTLASLACGVAQSATMLVLCRVVQGIGGATIFSTALALLAQTFQGRERGVAFGIWGAGPGIATALGPVLGGALVSGLGWRWIFFVNLPIGLVAIAIAATKIGEWRPPHARRLDLPGAGLFTAGLVSLVLGLIESGKRGWAD